MADPRAFISFDFDHDERWRNLFAGQAKKDSPTPFVAADWSSRSVLPQTTWEEQMERRIASTNFCVVLVGRHMASAAGVAKEITMAGRRSVPVFGVYVDRAATTTSLPAGLARSRTVAWSWDKIAQWVRQCMTEGKNS